MVESTTVSSAESAYGMKKRACLVLHCPRVDVKMLMRWLSQGIAALALDVVALHTSLANFA